MVSILLHLALALLIAAQQPNVPQDVKSEAISVAHKAITAAMSEAVYNEGMADEQQYTPTANGQEAPAPINFGPSERDPNVPTGNFGN